MRVTCLLGQNFTVSSNCQKQVQLLSLSEGSTLIFCYLFIFIGATYMITFSIYLCLSFLRGYLLLH
jgi:hypothetical protein